MKKIIIGIIIVIVLVIIIGAGSDDKTTTTPTKETTVTKQEKVDLAAATQKAYLDNIGYGSITELNLDEDNLVGKPYNEIVSFTDKGSGQVYIEVQDVLTKKQATQIAESVLASASDVEGLRSVFVDGTNHLNGWAVK